MDPIEVLPDVSIEPKGIVSEEFLKRGIRTLWQACHWLQDLTYGSNSNSENSLILFTEDRGTCTTKHGVLARLAQELEVEITKNLGFYRLNDEIVTGVNAILQPYGLAFIPQIHCFLCYRTFRIDLTEGNCNGKNKTITVYDFVIPVSPDLSCQQENDFYVETLQKYFLLDPDLANVGTLTILSLLDKCNRQVKYQCSLMSNYLASMAL